MSARLRILFVAPYEPSALAVRSRLLLGAMAERHDVDFLTLCRDPGVPARTTGRLLAPCSSGALDRFLALRHLANRSYPFQAMAVASRAMSRAVRTALAGNDYDLVHVEHVRALPYLPVRCRVPVLWDAVDCVSGLFRMAALERRPPLRWLFAAEAGRLARQEAIALTSMDTVVVSSEREAAAMQELDPQARIAVITNPVDVGSFAARAVRQPARVVMTGKMSYHANAFAARWLVESIWPRVRAQHHGARLLIAGACPPRTVRRLAAADITVTGFVDDLAAAIGSAAVAVAPLPYAAGVQNKVLEAMACSTPVVATPAAVGDLPLRHGRDVLVADGPEEFAACIKRLLRDEQLARSIGSAGRRYVERHHSLPAVADRLEAQYWATLCPADVRARTAALVAFGLARRANRSVTAPEPAHAPIAGKAAAAGGGREA